jgi:putative transposase
VPPGGDPPQRLLSMTEDIHPPGDLVQVDTFDLSPLPGMVFKQFTARDVVSRWDVLMVARQPTAHGAARFLDILIERMPFCI